LRALLGITLDEEVGNGELAEVTHADVKVLVVKSVVGVAEG
jgi:hypothetical protein